MALLVFVFAFDANVWTMIKPHRQGMCELLLTFSERSVP